jgi:hypothetical protein
MSEVTTVYRKPALLVPVALLLLSQGGAGKCVNRVIQLEGVIAGPSGGDLTVSVQVTPESNWEPQPEIVIKDHKFSATVLFNPVKWEDRLKRNDCSRLPESLEVVLLKDGSNIDVKKLEIARDFVKDKLGDYKLRSPITLHTK